jgi:hypothetical protein
MVVVVGRAPAKNDKVWQGHWELIAIDLSAYTKYRMEKLYTTQRTEISYQILETLQPFSNWLRFAEFRNDDDEYTNLLKCEDKELSLKLQAGCSRC